MDIEEILIVRQTEKISRLLDSVENQIHDLRWELYKLKNTSHLLDEAFLEMQGGICHERT